MRVKRVRRVHLDEAVPVYDMTVPKTENFCLGNGAVVHNSKDVSDAMAGVAIGLSKRIEIWKRHGVPLTNIPKSLQKGMKETK